MTGAQKLGREPGSSAFTLTEVVIAIGLFVFALVGVVALLGAALTSSGETLNDSAVAMALGTTQTRLAEVPRDASQAEFYFDRSGRLLAGEEGAYFRFALQRVAPAHGPAAVEYFTVAVTAPHPDPGAYEQRFLLARLQR